MDQMVDRSDGRLAHCLAQDLISKQVETNIYIIYIYIYIYIYAMTPACARATPIYVRRFNSRQSLLQDNASQALFFWGWRLLSIVRKNNSKK